MSLSIHHDPDSSSFSKTAQTFVIRADGVLNQDEIDWLCCEADIFAVCAPDPSPSRPVPDQSALSTRQRWQRRKSLVLGLPVDMRKYLLSCVLQDVGAPASACQWLAKNRDAPSRPISLQMVQALAVDVMQALELLNATDCNPVHYAGLSRANILTCLRLFLIHIARAPAPLGCMALESILSAPTIPVSAAELVAAEILALSGTVPCITAQAAAYLSSHRSATT